MALYCKSPYIALLFTPIPFLATLEIMSIFLLVLVVIIPTVGGGWNEFSDARISEFVEYDGNVFCTEHKDACIPYIRKSITSSSFCYCSHPLLTLLFLQGLIYLGPVLLLCALSITIMIASYFAERSNRKSFIQRKLVQVGADAFSKHNTIHNSSSY